MPQGQQLKGDSPGNEDPWCALFGSLIYPTGEGLYPLQERKRHQEVQAHLEGLIQGKPPLFWIVVMDNASAHTPPKLKDFWETHRSHLQAVFLPPYSPHLNLIERLGRFLRGQMTRNQVYESLPAQCQEIVQWLETLPFSRFCSLMGIEESQLLILTEDSQ